MSHSIKLLGIPFDKASSFLRGSAAGPAAIRCAFAIASSNTCAESGRDLAKEPRFIDAGDIELPTKDLAAAQRAIEAACSEQLAESSRLMVLGGDHSVTIGVMRAYAKLYPDLSILHFDAHPDLYQNFEGEPLSHACPFARIMEEGLCKRLVQVGIRTMNAQQGEQVARYGVEVHDMATLVNPPILHFDGPVYVSFDLDGLDPAFAPGVSHHEPGGLSTRQALQIIQTFTGQVIGADVVELNPACDVSSMTAMVAAKLMKELVDRMLG